MAIISTWHRGLLRGSITVVAAAAMLAGRLDASGARAAATDGYRLTPGDAVSFDFLDDAVPAELLTVSSSGQVTIPLIGGFSVADLTLREATDAIRAALVERKFFVDPQISLAVASFRPIYVLGEVRVPGSFAFQPMMTVEQAVAMAGGQATATIGQEDRIVTQARLRGQIEGFSVELAREALAVARIVAQLDGRAEISQEDFPANARERFNEAIVTALLPTEQRILEVELRAFETRRDQLGAAIGEVNGALDNLAQLAENQKAAIQSAREDRDRIQKLYGSGIKTLTDIGAIDREVASQESHLLEIFNQMSTTRRELGELQRALADATDNRVRLALGDLQTHRTQIEELIASRRAAEEQNLLLGHLASEDASETRTTIFSYTIRRKVEDATHVVQAALDDEVSPGDTILVAIERVPPDPRRTLSSVMADPIR